jgi:hypothetical protein
MTVVLACEIMVDRAGGTTRLAIMVSPYIGCGGGDCGAGILHGGIGGNAGCTHDVGIHGLTRPSGGSGNPGNGIKCAGGACAGCDGVNGAVIVACIGIGSSGGGGGGSCGADGPGVIIHDCVVKVFVVVP